MKNKRKGKFLMITGLLLVAAALFLTVYNIRQASKADSSAAAVLTQLQEKIVETPQETQRMEFTDADGLEVSWPVDETGAQQPAFELNPEMEMPSQKIDGNYYIGVLEIPALEISLPIMSDWSYPKLRVAPCRYKGSVYSGDLIIAGHNYARHFGGLRSLKAGDAVRFTDADGNVFSYSVAELETLGGADVEKMQAGDWDLTLFTCTYGGRTRVTVRCVLEGYSSN